MKKLIEKKWLLLISITIVGFAIDLYTKMLAVKMLPDGQVVKIVGDYFGFVLVYNKAMLFGLDPRKIFPFLPLNSIFIVATSIAIVLLTIYYKTIKSTERLTLLGLALVMPGAVGNLFDRIVYPGRGVVDFVRMGISERVCWPIYNMADAYVTIGVALLFISFFIGNKKAQTPS